MQTISLEWKGYLHSRLWKTNPMLIVANYQGCWSPSTFFTLYFLFSSSTRNFFHFSQEITYLSKCGEHFWYNLIFAFKSENLVFFNQIVSQKAIRWVVGLRRNTFNNTLTPFYLILFYNLCFYPINVTPT